MVLIADEGGGLAFRTPEEIRRSIEEGITLDPDELAIRVEDAMELYLESDIHLNLVQRKIDRVIVDYPDIEFNPADMVINADTMELVRAKFNSVRILNIDLENTAKNSGSFASPSHAVYSVWDRYTIFMRQYAYALGGYTRNPEIALIKKLNGILFTELGFKANIGEAFVGGITSGFSAIGKGIGGAVGFITETIISPIAEGILEGLLGADWKKKLVIIIVVIIIIVILVVIGLYYGKAYVGAKAIKRATT